MSTETLEQSTNAEEFIDMHVTGDLAVAEPSKVVSKIESRRHALQHIFLPLLFLAVTLLGGFRLGAVDNAFLFLKPALICLVFAAMTLVLYTRSGFIEIGGWISEHNSVIHNVASVSILLTLFTGTVQMFNSLLPEQGLPFWIVGFCLFWSIWNNLFAEFDPHRLLKSMVALFALAFVVKYLLLTNLTAAPSDNWLQGVIANPGKEALTYMLDLPRYSAGTGYIQFFTLAFYLLGLFFIPRRLNANN